MEGPDIVMAVLLLTLAALWIWSLHVRVKMLEMLAEREKAFLDKWRGHAGAELDGLLLLAKNHEARIAGLEKQP